MDTSALPTEQFNPRYLDLDVLDERNLLERLLNDQERSVQTVRSALPALTSAVAAAAELLASGGRLVYAGAGTSGRLCQIDAAELVPTFSWPAERAVTLMAGGQRAFFSAVENAEDDVNAAEADFLVAGVTSSDVVLGMAASGTTAYVVRILQCARKAGALTIGVANNPSTPILEAAEHPILLQTGPEVLSGSTRLKAGTAQKIMLSIFSTAVMVRLGKTYQNLMVDMVATNEKLHRRAVKLTAHAADLPAEEAQRLLKETGWDVKTSIAMARLQVDAAKARTELKTHHGRLRDVFSAPGSTAKGRPLPPGLIVSCQARVDNPLHGPPHMLAMALAAQQAGAVGLRVNGTCDIRAIRDACDLPIIGINKDFSAEGGVYITPSCQDARAVARAGADIIAIDATQRPRATSLRDLVDCVQQELGLRVMADISTFEEAEKALALGVDYIGTTLSGYTPYSPQMDGPDVALVQSLVSVSSVPVVAEGRIREPQDIRVLREVGTQYIVVGTAITNPREITRRLLQAWNE